LASSLQKSWTFFVYRSRNTQYASEVISGAFSFLPQMYFTTKDVLFLIELLHCFKEKEALFLKRTAA